MGANQGLQLQESADVAAASYAAKTDTKLAPQGGVATSLAAQGAATTSCNVAAASYAAKVQNEYE